MTRNQFNAMLGPKIIKAHRRNDRASVLKLIKVSAWIGHTNKMAGYPENANEILELHYSNSEREFHIEFFNGQEECIIPEKGVLGQASQKIEGYGCILPDKSCPWAEKHHISTLDDLNIHLPDWLGGDTVVGPNTHLLIQQMVDLI